MAKGIKLTDEYLDNIFSQVTHYQNVEKCSNQIAYKHVADKLGISPKSIGYAFAKAKGRNRVVETVAKKKDVKTKQTKIAAVSLSAKLDAEKMIFDYVKSLGFFKRLLACIIGLDKLCYNYGGKKMD